MNINTITAYLLVSNTDAVELKQQLRGLQMNINTITAYLLVSNTDAVELKQQLRSFDASEDMCKVISLLSEEWYVHKRLNNLFDYALLGVSPDKCVYHFENIRNSERFDIYLNNYSF